MRAAVALFATAVLSLLLTVEYPDVMIKPGALSEGHRALGRDCMRCHVAGSGARSDRCATCHALDRLGLTKVDGTPLDAAGRPEAVFHRHLANTDCAGCHVVHLNERKGPEQLAFRHEFLAAADREDCATCHAGKKPADRLHEAAGSSCAACHTAGGWSPATFDHARVTASGVSCVSCHHSRMPADDLHRQEGGDCRVCHSTRAWKPASLEHSRYFRFDRHHPSNCSACHTRAGTFKTYSCYGCHEHSPAKIAAEHIEEGITDFDDCVRCHRGGDEGEGGRSGEGHGGRGEREEDEH